MFGSWSIGAPLQKNRQISADILVSHYLKRLHFTFFLASVVSLFSELLSWTLWTVWSWTLTSPHGSSACPRYLGLKMTHLDAFTHCVSGCAATQHVKYVSQYTCAHISLTVQCSVPYTAALEWMWNSSWLAGHLHLWSVLKQFDLCFKTFISMHSSPGEDRCDVGFA